MKTFLSAIAILVLISVSVTLTSIYVTNTAERILHNLDEMPRYPCTDAEKRAEEIEKYANKRAFLINLSVGHIESESIYSKIIELKVRSSGGESDYLSALAALRDGVEDLKRSEAFSLSMLF